jgi:hypothetical protein
MSATARSAFCFRTGFIDVQRSPTKVCAIQRSNRLIRFRSVGHFNESKTPGLPGVPIGHDADTINCTVCFEHESNRSLGRSEAEITYKDIFHFTFLSEVAEQIEAGSDGAVAVGPDYLKMPKSNKLLTTLQW